MDYLQCGVDPKSRLWHLLKTKLLVRYKVGTWKHVHLSQAGKKVLIKFVLSAIPTYHRAKMCWRIICKPKALWVLVLKGLYFLHQDFLSASKGPKPSWAWSSLLEGSNIISEFSRWQVLNGESIATWSDRWVPGVPGNKLSASHLAATEYEPYQKYLIIWLTEMCLVGIYLPFFIICLPTSR